MNGNRGQYTSAPMNNMRNMRPGHAPQGGEAPDRPRKSTRCPWLAVMLSLALPVLFLLLLFISNAALRIGFIVLTLASLLCMWGMRAFVRNARSTLTIVYLALAAVIGVTLLLDSQTPESRAVSQSSRDAQNAIFSSSDMGVMGNYLKSQETPQPVSGGEENQPAAVSAAQQQLELFLRYWAENKIDKMLELCAPSWVAQQKLPSQQLWQIIFQRRPTGYQIESISGSDADTSRTVTLKLAIAQSSAQIVQRMQVLMLRVNDVWYIDPQSLNGVTVDEAAEAAAQAGREMIATTIAPTATPENNPNALKVYYNPNGGAYYHTSETCASVKESLWPLTAIYYSELNSQKYKQLLPCDECHPPARPAL